jgi:glutaredoxin
MYVIIGKQKCIQCDELKNLLDEKGIQYNYLDMTEMPHKTMTYLRMYCNSVPIVLNIKHSFSNFEEILRHFNQILTHFNHLNYFYILYLYYYIIILLLSF